MAGERRYTRIPPESSGDRLYMSHTAQIPYDTKDASYVWVTDASQTENYTISGGGGDSFDIHIHSINETTTVAGFLQVHYSAEATFNNYNAVNNQEIKDSSGTVRALVNGDTISIYIPNYNIVGSSDPSHGLNVDRKGAMYTRFTDGPAEISSFGKLRVAQQKLVAQYSFAKNAMTQSFTNAKIGTGGKDWLEDQGAIRLSATLNNDLSTHTSNYFHPVIPNSGILFTFAARLGNFTDSDGLIRNWGAFDSTDGFFFQANSTSTKVFNVVHRFTLDGNAVQNHTIPQSSFNKDTLDGSGSEANPSGMLIDLTKLNNFWVDYQFQGGGRTRWGVYYKGQRVVCHELDLENGNQTYAAPAGTFINNALSNPARPVCWAQKLTTGAGPYYFYAYGSGVYMETDADIMGEAPVVMHGADETPLPRDTTTNQLTIFTLSPKRYLPWAPAVENHSLYAPKILDVFPSPANLSESTIVGDGATVTVTTNTPHYLTVGEKFDIYNTTSYNGRHVIATVISGVSFTFADTPATSEVGEIRKVVKPDNRPIEVRVMANCNIRGAFDQNVGGNTQSTVTYDLHGEMLNDGYEFSRFIIDKAHQHDFDRLHDHLQYGAATNTSDQGLSRITQKISASGNIDTYSTGTEKVVIRIDNLSNKKTATTSFMYEDRAAVVFTQEDGAAWTNASPASLDHSQYSSLSNDTTEVTLNYLSLMNSSDAWLYTSLANIDDDRSVRAVTVSSLTNIVVGDTFTVGTGQAYVKKLSVVNGTTYVALEGRNANFDTAFINGAVFSTTSTGGGTLTINPITSTNRIGGTGDFAGWTELNDRDSFDLDYKTSLLAIDSSSWTAPAAVIASDLIAINGTPRIRVAWSFTVRHLEVEDTDTNIRMSMSWKEITQ